MEHWPSLSDEQEEKLIDLDNQFFELDEDFEERLYPWIVKNKEQFSSLTLTEELAIDGKSHDKASNYRPNSSGLSDEQKRLLLDLQKERKQGIWAIEPTEVQSVPGMQIIPTFSVTNHKSNETYYLYSKNIADGRMKLYYFSTELKEGALAEFPDGYELFENATTGRPIVKKK